MTMMESIGSTINHAKRSSGLGIYDSMKLNLWSRNLKFHLRIKFSHWSKIIDKHLLLTIYQLKIMIQHWFLMICQLKITNQHCLLMIFKLLIMNHHLLLITYQKQIMNQHWLLENLSVANSQLPVDEPVSGPEQRRSSSN